MNKIPFNIQRIITIWVISTLLAVSFSYSRTATAQTEPPIETPSTEPYPVPEETPVEEQPIPAAPAQEDSTEMPPVRWQLTLELHPDLAFAAQQEPDQVLGTYEAAGLTAAVKDGALNLQSEAGIEQMNSVLFDNLSPGMDFLGGVVDLVIHLPSNGAPVTLNLESRITAGYYWVVQPGDSDVYTQSGESQFQTRYIAYGAPAVQTIHLEPNGDGDAAVLLQYQRPFGPEESVHASLDLFLAEPIEQIDILDPTPDAPVTEISPSDSGAPDALDQIPPVKGLPTSFDWRSRGVVPPIRQQGSCGSCWAFGTVGIFESALRKVGGPLVDMSEQFLVSCNKDGWDCDGGFTAHKYHYNTLGTSQSQIGAVLEAEKPYITSNGTCTTALKHPYRLHNWKFVTGSEWTVASVDQIKNAIYTYGPITTAICTGQAFLNYSGGIFETNENVCSGYTNHQVILVGWNDSTRTWILRNSHGPYWGESGYMRVRWGTSRVGEGVSWVIPGATPLAPGSATTDRTPTFRWNKAAGASSYQVQAYKAGSLKYNKTISSKSCGTSYCNSTPTSALEYGNYTWKVRAKEGLFWKPYSASKTFSIVSSVGFNSEFNGSMSGWARKSGANWNVSGSVLYTYGTVGKWTSAYRTTSPYANFDYSTRVYRYGGVVNGWYPASYIAVRMGDTTRSTDNWWYPGYLFGYSNNGYYAIWKARDTGSDTAIQNWTYTSAIVQNGWNTLRVVTQGTTFYFYINGTLVRTVTDPDRGAGYVGFNIYSHPQTVSTQMMVDWARLSVRPLSASAQTQVDPQQEALNQAALQAPPIGTIEGIFVP